MEEAQEKDMDHVASFKSGKLLKITDRQYNVCSETQMINLLVSSNRYGYIFYATENDGLVIIPSTHIDRESRYLSKSSEDDDDDDNTENENNGKSSIIHRSYIPGQSINKNGSITPYWIALNSDETILSVVLLQSDSNSWIIILYDVVKLIQIPDAPPMCSPVRLSGDSINNTIQNFTWNPAIPNIFAYLDGCGSISCFEIDQNAKQLKPLGKSDANDDNSSICWSPKGKQIVVVKYDGALELYEPNMKLKKSYTSATLNQSFPPCISVLWISTSQFLLGFSEDSPEENTNDNIFFQILVTYDKDQPPKTQIYYDLFFDTPDAPIDVNSQYFYIRLNETKIVFTGLSKSLKINVLGPNEPNQDSLDIWTFADQYRAAIKGSGNVNSERPILTGMALGLNSTLSIAEGNKKLPPCPILLLSNSEGVLQVYYFIHKTLPPICRAPEVLKSVPVSQPQLQQAPPSNPFPPFPTSVKQPNGLPFTNPGVTPFNNTISGTTNPAPFNFSQQSVQTQNTSSLNDLLKSTSIINSNTSPFAQQQQQQQTPLKMNNAPPAASASNSDNKKLLQIVNEFQVKLKSVAKPLSKSSDSLTDLDKSLDELTTKLNNMLTTLQTSKQSIKTMTSEYIESMTTIENARHQIKSSQKENLYHSLKDRELDPWTQARLELIKTKYDELKNKLNILLQLTRTTIHDKSVSTNNDDDETENEDFIPELEISLNTDETMKQRIQKRLLELSHKVSETEKDLEFICTKFKNTDFLSSTTFTKTTMSSERPFHNSDAQILSYLQANRPQVDQIQVPPAPVINLSTILEQKKPTTPSIQSTTPSIQPSTPKQTNSPTVESESFKNMLRIVRTSIDLFSGVTSPEQLQELSSTIATSPLSSTTKSNITSINKTPTIPKATNLTKTSSVPIKQVQLNTTNILQTPAKSVTSVPPTISVTPATPATQGMPFDTALKLQPNKTITQTATDLTKTQTTASSSSSSSSGDIAIRQLLNNSFSPPATLTSVPTQPIIPLTTQSQAVKTPLFGTISSTSAAPVISQTASTTATPVIATQPTSQSPFGAPTSSPASTTTTSVQAVSPTTKPVISTGTSSFGSKPTIGGGIGFNLTTTPSSTVPFGSAATSGATGTLFGGGSAAAAATTSSPAPFGSGFGATTTAATSTPSTGVFGTSTSSASSPFGSGFGASVTPAVTTSAPSTGIFGGAPSSTSSSAFGGFGGSATATTTTSAPSAGIFGSGLGSPATTTSAPSTGAFGSGFGTSAAPTSPFGSGFSAPTSTSSTSPFGGFGGTSSSTSGSTFGGFGAAPSLAQTSTASTGAFGSTSSGTIFSGFGAAASVAPTSTTSTSIFGGAPSTSSGSMFGAAPSLAPASTGSGSLFGGGSGTSPFGSGFSGFNTQSSASGQSTGFSFGGFSAQPSDTTTTQSGFGSFGASSAAAQPSSSFGGGGGFGGASGQQPGFGAPSSPFGAQAAQSASSPSFTNYRK